MRLKKLDDSTIADSFWRELYYNKWLDIYDVYRNNYKLTASDAETAFCIGRDNRLFGSVRDHLENSIK